MEGAVSRLLKRAAVVFAVALAAAQLVQPDRVNPATDASRTIQAQAGTASGLAAVLDRACNDCHSNKAAWPWVTRIAPVSWVWARGLREAREAVNFSEWAAYQRDHQQTLLAASCQDASNGKMPGPWTMVRPEARLSAQDIETICAASRQADALAARGF